jgi:NADH-quinone oxidoreductase subunit F
VLNRIEAGAGMQPDLDLLLSVSKNIIGNTICALGDAAAMPAISFVTKFRDEFQHHIDHKCCLTGTLMLHGVR